MLAPGATGDERGHGTKRHVTAIGPIPSIAANGAKIPLVGLGTWELHGRTCARAVEQALRLGYRHVDTAEMYDNERDVGDGIRAGMGANTVLMLSIASAITVAAWAPYWISWPIMFNQSLAVGVWIIGWIYCGLSTARLLGAEVSARFIVDEAQRAARVSMLVIAASAMLFLAGLFGGRPAVSLAMLFTMNLFTGAMMPLLQSWFNEQLEPHNRATLLSFNTTFATGGGALGLLFAGRIADTAGIPFEWQIAGLISLCAAPVYWAMRRREVAEVALAGSAK